MTEYTADMVWERGTQDFLKGRYSRHHLMRFDGGAEVAGSSSPHSVPLRPEAIFSGERLPTHEQLDRLYHVAHEECFITNSVRTELRCEPVYGDA